MTPTERMALWDDLDQRLANEGRCYTVSDYNLRQSFADWEPDEIDDLVASVRIDARHALEIIDIAERLGVRYE